MEIKFIDLGKQYSMLNIDSLMEDIKVLIKNGRFVGGEPLDIFEDRFAYYNSVDYAVGVGSGTDALIFALLSLGVGKGDEVLVPANTFIATAFAVTHVGATPVFVDVNSNTYLINSNIERYITKKTKAIIPVHLYGNTVDMITMVDIAERYNLYLIEDCAQAIGAEFAGKKVGSWGDVGCFSFYPAKNLGGLGQGGAITTNNEDIATKIRSIGNVGRKPGSWYEYTEIGYNSRLDSINALFLNYCLNYVDTWNGLRKQVASRYETNLSDNYSVIKPFVDSKSDHVYHLYELQFKSKEIRDEAQKFLKNEGVPTALHYPIPCHKQTVYVNTYGNCNLPIAERLCDSLLSFPMHPYLSDKEVNYIVNKLNEFLLSRDNINK